MRGRVEEIPAYQNMNYEMDSTDLVADFTLLHTSYKTKNPRLKLETQTKMHTPCRDKKKRVRGM
jgi:hypothetical protein